MKNLSHSASLQSEEKIAPSNPGVKQLGGDLKLINLDPAKTRYCIGAPGDHMLVRAVFELPNMFGFAISRQVETAQGEIHIVEASRVFRNEPFKSNGPVTC